MAEQLRLRELGGNRRAVEPHERRVRARTERVFAVPSRPALVAAFSWLGLADIFVALGTGMYLLLVVQDPMFVVPVATFPYPMIPAIVVPLLILSHALVIARVSRRTAR